MYNNYFFYKKIMNNLNSQIWKNTNKIDKDVREKLLNVAKIFLKTIETPIELENIFLTGSLATYLWTPISDLDLHIIVKVLDEKCITTISDYFETKSKNFNINHFIEIRGYKVEVNIKTEEVERTGKAIYDLLENAWVTKPIKPNRTMEDHDVLTMVSRFQYEIDSAINNQQDLEVFKDIRKEIKQLRIDGLRDEGEYSIGNLVFKSLRNSGHTEKLLNVCKNLEDKSVSLESFKDYLYR
jgi:hypothetical protein